VSRCSLTGVFVYSFGVLLWYRDIVQHSTHTRAIEKGQCKFGGYIKTTSAVRLHNALTMHAIRHESSIYIYRYATLLSCSVFERARTAISTSSIQPLLLQARDQVRILTSLLLGCLLDIFTPPKPFLRVYDSTNDFARAGLRNGEHTAKQPAARHY
jgi:hypothetical protein